MRLGGLLAAENSPEEGDDLQEDVPRLRGVLGPDGHEEVVHVPRRGEEEDLPQYRREGFTEAVPCVDG